MRSWKLKTFSQLSLDELYAITAAREEVFVVGQKVNYVDADGMDKKASHLWCEDGGNIVAYARIFAPGIKFAEASFGRVLTTDKYRAMGHGKAIVSEIISRIRTHHGAVKIKISAQAHLQKFYEDFGFKVTSEIYDDVGIPHIDMVL